MAGASSWASRMSEQRPQLPARPNTSPNASRMQTLSPLSRIASVREGTVNCTQKTPTMCSISICKNGHVYSCTIAAKYSVSDGITNLTFNTDQNGYTLSFDQDFIITLYDSFGRAIDPFDDSNKQHVSARYSNLPSNIKHIYERIMRIETIPQSREQSSESDESDDFNDFND